MSVPPYDRRPAATPAHTETSPLRVLAGIALVAVTVCAVSLTILAWQAISATNGVQDTVDRVDDASRDLDPAIRDLRRSARALREAASETSAAGSSSSP